MYLGWDAAHRRRQLFNLDSMLYGYQAALEAHGIEEPGRTFRADFVAYLVETRRWPGDSHGLGREAG
jgi:hypothetical protein